MYTLRIDISRRATLSVEQFDLAMRDWFDGFQRNVPLGSAIPRLWLRSPCAINATLGLIAGNVPTQIDAVMTLDWTSKEDTQADLGSLTLQRHFRLAIEALSDVADTDRTGLTLFDTHTARDAA